MMVLPKCYTKMVESIFDIAQNRGVQNDTYFHRFHYENTAAHPCFGVAKPVIIGHGISNDVALKHDSCCRKMISSNLCKQISNRFIGIIIFCYQVVVTNITGLLRRTLCAPCSLLSIDKNVQECDATDA